MRHTLRAVGVLVVAVAMSGLTGTAAHAAAGHPAGCIPETDVSINSHSTLFMGVPGTHFKDGPGGTITVSVTRSTTLSATMTVSAEVSISDIISSAKLSVSASITKSDSITIGHQYSHNISKSKYGNVQYGSWGYHLKWSLVQFLPTCTSRVIDSGTANVPVNAVGWRYWETSA